MRRISPVSKSCAFRVLSISCLFKKREGYSRDVSPFLASTLRFTNYECEITGLAAERLSPDYTFFRIRPRHTPKILSRKLKLSSSQHNFFFLASLITTYFVLFARSNTPAEIHQDFKCSIVRPWQRSRVNSVSSAGVYRKFGAGRTKFLLRPLYPLCYFCTCTFVVFVLFLKLFSFSLYSVSSLYKAFAVITNKFKALETLLTSIDIH